MKVLDSLNFQPLLITDLFVPHKGKRLIAADRKKGSTPFVGGSEANNSITDFSEVDPLFPGGWLTLVYNGSVGHTRLQPAPFFASDDVIALEPREPQASTTALLMCAAIIQRECVNKYSYGSKLNLQRLKRQTILVPVTTDESGTQVVDWDGLDRLGNELFEQVITQTRSARQTDPDDDDALPQLRFEPILITDVFETMKASRAWYDKSKLLTGGPATYPFISRTSASNGMDGLCCKQAKPPEPGNAITIGLDTQTIGYQPVPFYTSQNIQVLRHRKVDEHNGPVLVSLIGSQMGKFSWGGNGATLGRLRKTRIMVPVTTDANGEQVVDWDGMSAYGLALRVRAERSISAVLAPSP